MRSRTKVVRLNADRVDGRDSSAAFGSEAAGGSISSTDGSVVLDLREAPVALNCLNSGGFTATAWLDSTGCG